ncbi:outer membrane lipoprotein-sorting protein [Candidatus Marinamargulisbacteria bacterium SCGC AG-343-D04]|nr:outer membrane lipoprotein-sorting protein [Candidatus Marinamargulisbacteria bacterium SCGC AG-343-D04]
MYQFCFGGLARVFLFMIVSSVALYATELDKVDINKGYRISLENQEVNNGFVTQQSMVKMILINAHGDKVERRMSFMGMEVDGDGDKSLITFLYPADVKGTKTLTWSHKEGPDDMWLLLPALNRVKRINSRNKSGSFMGSEFSYEDISSDEAEKYTYNFIEDSTLDGREVWVIERYPKDKNSGYSKQVTYVDKEYRNPWKIVYFDRKGELLKTSVFSQYKKIDRWWLFNRIEVMNHQTQKSSILEWQNRELGNNLKSSLFTKQYLKR